MKQNLVLVTCLVVAVTSISFAGENAFLQFNSDVEKAYTAYRKALFQTNKRDAEKSGQANDMFIRQWQLEMDDPALKDQQAKRNFPISPVLNPSIFDIISAR